MINWIKGFFNNNIWLKLLSLVLAFGIWLFVVNVSDPEIKTSVLTTINTDYAESLTNLNKYYSMDTSNARVSFSVRTNQRNRVTASDFYTYVDMRDYSITGALPVYVTVSDNVKDLVSDVSVSPLVVHATTEDMQEKSFDLAMSIKGSPAEGFAVGPATYSPSRVTLYGPNSEIGKISRVGFTVDVDGASDRIWGSAEFVFYDANDNPITPDIRIMVKNSVSYIVPIYKKKNVSITVQTSGTPANGYSLDSVSCDPSFIEIYGDSLITDNISAIILPASLLNISSAYMDVTATIDISNYLPEGVYTDTVTNIALIARISRNSIVPPILDTPDGRRPSGSGGTGGPGSRETEADTKETAGSEKDAAETATEAAEAAKETAEHGNEAADAGKETHAGEKETQDAADEDNGDAGHAGDGEEDAENEASGEEPAEEDEV